jgi:universal stress protein A
MAPAIKSVLCPVNFSAAARDALSYAGTLAAAFDAELIVLNVLAGGFDSGPFPRFLPHFNQWVDEASREHCRTTQVVLRGNPAERVLEIANSDRASLIVMGGEHRRFADATVIGTTTEHVTRFAQQPVLTVIHTSEVSQAEERFDLVEAGSQR